MTKRGRYAMLSAAGASAFLWSSLALVWGGMILVPQRGMAQSRNAGEIRGTVTDSSGAAVSGVQVVATDTATGLAVKGVTGDSGVYDLPYVEAGQYSVRFTRPGFETYVKTGVGLHIETITVNAVLQVGAVSTSVDVKAAPDLLQTESAEQSTVVSALDVTELPVVGRNWQTLIELLPGVTPGKGNTSDAASTVSINGAQQWMSAWLIDGGPATLPISYNPDLLSPPQEAIQEVDIVTQGFGAETGNGFASFNVITKSGTNQFHGSAWEFNQNDIYNAAPKNWSSKPEPKPAVRWNMFGGALGGPIVRNKLFFFLSYQYNPTVSYTSGLYSFPTDDLRAGNFSNSTLPQIFDPATTTTRNGQTTRQPFAGNTLTRFDPVALAIQKFFPEPNAINPSSPYVNNYYFAAPEPTQQAWYDWKIDGNLSPNNHIYTSGIHTREPNFTPSPDCPVDCNHRLHLELASQITDAWTVSGTKLNELRLAFARETSLSTPETEGANDPAEIGLPQLPSNTFPIITASGGIATMTMGGNGLQQKLVETSVTASDTFTWILGKHTVKVGGEYDNWTDYSSRNQLDAGSFNFNGIGTRNPSSPTSTGIGYADFLLGYTQSWGVAQPIENGGRIHNEQFFAQDYFKVMPNLTVNFGARIVHQIGWSDEHNRIALYDPTLINPATGNPGALGFAGVQIPSTVLAPILFVNPRAGFAWTPFHGTSIRGGFGLYSSPWSGDSYLTGIGTGFSVQGSAQSTDNLTDVFQLSSGPPPPVVPTAASRTPALLNGQSVPYIPYHAPMNYVDQFQLSVEQQFGNYLLEGAYLGNLTRHLIFASDINQATNLQTGIRPNPTFQSINATLFTGEGNYNALQLTARRQFANGFSLLANYTWSKSIDTGTGQGGNSAGMDAYQNAYSPAANYAASAGDVRNLFNGSAVYQLPFGRGRQFLKNSKGLVDEILGGWQASTAFTYRSGLPFTPLMGTANLSFSQAGNWFPNRIGSGKLAHPTTKEWFDTSAFVEPTPHTFGDSRRNILYGPHYADVDLSLAKTFPLSVHERPLHFQLKLDTFDLFNHPNYGLPNASVGSGSGYGTITSSYTNRTMQVGGILRF